MAKIGQISKASVMFLYILIINKHTQNPQEGINGSGYSLLFPSKYCQI